jgi:diacylglycerol kinase (ATP)
VSSTDTATSTGGRFVVIFNKRALAARALRHSGLAQALDERKLDYEIADTETREQARAVSRQAAEAGRIAVAAGGDGTAFDVANGILGSSNPGAVMGHVPLGTGNDLSLSMGRLSDGIERALDALAEGRAIPIDVGQVNGGEYFLNVLGVGFDAEVARRQSGRKIKLPSYFPDVVRTIFRYEPKKYSVRWPDGLKQGRALMATAMNGIYEGGGVKLAPHASLEDGLLDVYWIDPISLWQFARYVWAVRRGRHERLPLVTYLKTDRFTLWSDSPIQYHLDGEYRELAGGSSLEVALHRQALRMIV